jgi:hypothetical protein
MNPFIAHRDFERGLDRLHAEAAGVLTMTIVRADEASDLLLHAMCGDAQASLLLQAASCLSGRIAKATVGDAVLCGSCPRPLRHAGFALAVVAPSCDDPTQVLAFGICPNCASESSAIGAKAVEALSLIWPGSRAIVVTHAAGGQA